jgi:hypothetical protein
MYDFDDNGVAFYRGFPDPDAVARMRVMLGDRDANGWINVPVPALGIEGNEIPPATLPFLLWSAGPDMLYGPTNEEMITEIFRAYVRSYRDLPKILYHIQWKFRDEQRPRFGVMRGREFLMKDAYSFDIDEAAARVSYNKMFVAYLRTFARMGLKAIPMAAETGPIGGDLSHEFIILAETGESGVFCNKDVLELPVPGEGIDYEGDLTPHIRPGSLRSRLLQKAKGSGG